MCRAARQSDFDALIRIWEEAFGDTAEYCENFLDLFYAPWSAFALEDDGEVRAMAYLVYGAEYGAPAVACPYLYAVAVDVKYRGLGYGKAIVKFALLEARALGYRAVATCPEEPSLIAYYRKLGFAHDATLGGDFRPSAFMVQNAAFTDFVLVKN